MARLSYLLLLFLAATASAQVLNGVVRSVSTFETCTNSPLATDPSLVRPLIDVLQGAAGSNQTGNFTVADRTPCGILGENSTITVVNLFLETGQKTGGNTLVFTIPNLPNDPNNFDASATGECTGTLEGSDCQVLLEPLVISFETSNAVLAYYGIKDLTPIPYAMVWEQAETAELHDGTPATNTPYFTFSSTQSCADLNTNALDSFFTANPFVATPNAGPVGRTQQASVCPTPEQLLNADVPQQIGDVDLDILGEAAPFMPQLPPGVSNYLAINPTCNLLACPTTNDNLDAIWRFGYLQSLEPVCDLYHLQEEPRTLMNIEVLLGTTVLNTTSGEQVTAKIGELVLTTLQDGALLPDTSNTVLGALIDLKTPTGFLGQPLSGGIVTCGTCPTQTTDGEPPSDCRYGILSDISTQALDEDGLLAQTLNPWLSTPGGLAAIAEKCTVPTQACRRILLGDDTLQSFWMYYTEEDVVRMFGPGCSKNGMADDVFITRPEVAELMCAGNQQGTCVPGYQQIVLGNDFTSVTPCEISLARAQEIALLRNGVDVSFSGVPIDYNKILPNYWMDRTRLLREPTSQGQIQAQVVLYLSAEYVGEVVSVAGGEFVNPTLICSAIQNNPSGEVVAIVRNTGASVGDYRVTADFGMAVNVTNTTTGVVTTGFTAGDGTAVVTDVTDCTLQLEPNALGACTIPFTFAGPIDANLAVQLTLLSDVILAGRDPVVLDQVDATCFITSETGGGQIFGTVDLSAFGSDGDDDQNDSDDENDVCMFWQTFPWPNRCTPEGVSEWVARIGWWFLQILWLSLFVGVSIYFCMLAAYSSRTYSQQKKALSLKRQVTEKRSAAAATTTMLQTTLAMSFLCLCAAAPAATNGSEAEEGRYGWACIHYGMPADIFTESPEEWSAYVEALPVVGRPEDLQDSCEFRRQEDFFLEGEEEAEESTKKPMGSYHPFGWGTMVALLVVFSLLVWPLALITCNYLKGRSAADTPSTAPSVYTSVPSHLIVSSLCVLLCSGAMVQGQVDILGVSSFRECVFTLSSNDTIDCTASEFATTLDLRVQSPSGAEVNTATFNVALTTVPNQGSDEQQIGSGTTCPSPDDTKCQTTTPAQIEVQIDEAVLIYELSEVASTDSYSFSMPYNYFYMPQATVLGTNDTMFTGGAEALLDESLYQDVQCRFLSFYYTTGEVSLTGQSQLNTSYFNDNARNAQMLRCPNSPPETAAQPPFNPTTEQKAEGTVHYDFLCNYIRIDTNKPKQVNIEYSASFEDLGPFCKVYSISNPPQVGANIRVTVTTPTQTESLELQTITVGLDGSNAVSQPDRLVSATVLGTLSPDGLIGPDIQGYIVVCNSDQVDPGILNMVPDTVQQTQNGVSSDTLSFNPWRERPQTPGTATCPFNGTPYPKYPLPEPCGLSFLFDDPWAMFFYVPPSLAPTVGPQCAQLGVDRAIYRHPPPVMQFNTLLRTSGATVAVKDIIPSTQCFDSVCGNGEISDVITCVPGFGIGYLDIETRTPCNVQALFRETSANLLNIDQTQGENFARSVRAPYMPFQWSNAEPNFWLRTGPNYGLYYEPVSDSTAFEMLVTFAGQLVNYPQRVTNGLLDTDAASTFCTLNVTGATLNGAAFYKVCNQDRDDSTGNYNLAVDCGLVTDFNQTTGRFNAQTILVAPGNLLLSAVEAGTCRTAATDRPFLLEYLASATNLTTAEGLSNVQCNYKLFSADTLDPSSVLLSETSLVCSAVFDPTFTLNNETVYVPDTLTPFPNISMFTPTVSPTPTPGLSMAGTVGISILIGAIVLVILLCCCCLCVLAIVQKSQRKKLTEDYENVSVEDTGQ